MTGSRSLRSILARCYIIPINYPPTLTPGYCLPTGGMELPLQFLRLIPITTTTTTATTTTTTTYLLTYSMVQSPS